jgi:hypothetical protein
MTRSARGTLTKPGRNVRQKAGLNRAIAASGWGLLVTRLEQKAPGRVQKVSLYEPDVLGVRDQGPGGPREPSFLPVPVLRSRRER